MDILRQLFKTENIIWIIIIIILITGKFGFGLNYISIGDIILNHLKCFKNKDGKMMIVPIINYMGIPILLGCATTVIKTINSNSINIITVIVSILTAMLFTMLTMIIDMKSKIKEDPEYFSTEAELSKQSLIETYYTLMFEIVISIALLILCFFYCFTRKFGVIQSFLIYSLTYMLIVNLLMIIKRIFRVIDTNMNK